METTARLKNAITPLMMLFITCNVVRMVLTMIMTNAIMVCVSMYIMLAIVTSIMMMVRNEDTSDRPDGETADMVDAVSSCEGRLLL